MGPVVGKVIQFSARDVALVGGDTFQSLSVMFYIRGLNKVPSSFQMIPMDENCNEVRKRRNIKPLLLP